MAVIANKELFLMFPIFPMWVSTFPQQDFTHSFVKWDKKYKTSQGFLHKDKNFFKILHIDAQHYWSLHNSSLRNHSIQLWFINPQHVTPGFYTSITLVFGPCKPFLLVPSRQKCLKIQPFIPASFSLLHTEKLLWRTV